MTPITVYILPACQACDATKRVLVLDRAGVAYATVNLADDHITKGQDSMTIYYEASFPAEPPIGTTIIDKEADEL